MQRVISTIWQDTNGKELFRLNPDNSIYVIPVAFSHTQIDDIIEALEDARDLIQEQSSKREASRILDAAVN